MDVLTEKQRRKNMQNIKSQNTKIEIILRKALWQRGYRYRKNYAKLPGKPDIVLTKYKIAIFCDGEFWHGKDWKGKKEKTLKGVHGDFWVNKIETNIERDKKIDKELFELGWVVLRFWGNDIKKHTDNCIKTIEETICDLML